MIIYKSTNKINNKCYIGQTTKCFIKRINEHKNTTIKLKIYFGKALKKYGIDNFEWEIIDDTCQTKEELNEMEFHYIKQYHSHVSEYGYNLTFGGEGGNCGNQFTKHNTNNYDDLYGKKRSKIIRKKMSKSMVGKIVSDETKQKISKSQKGVNNSFYGKIHSDKTKKHISECQQGSKSTKSKIYKITYPDGKSVIIKGIRKFSRDNGLTYTLMISVAKGRQTHHKGFLCEYYKG